MIIFMGRKACERDLPKFSLDYGDFCNVHELIWYFVQRVLLVAKGLLTRALRYALILTYDEVFCISSWDRPH